MTAKVAAINAKYRQPGYEPVVWMERAVPLYERIALYSIADVVVVTATRDGMNLVPYEYIVCRQGPPVSVQNLSCSLARQGDHDPVVLKASACCAIAQHICANQLAAQRFQCLAACSTGFRARREAAFRARRIGVCGMLPLSGGRRARQPLVHRRGGRRDLRRGQDANRGQAPAAREALEIRVDSHRRVLGAGQGGKTGAC